MDLPYRAEYAKSGRSSCRSCKSPIAKDILRLAVMVQSPMFDGKSPNWYHFQCFFNKQRPKTVDDIAHFESLRYEDQEKIRGNVAGASAAVVVPSKKGKKRNAVDEIAKKAALKDFVLEYSKSSRAICRGCELKIMKEEVRISKKDFETDVGKRYGGQDMWHHLACFAKLRSELGYYECGDKLPGFKILSKDDQVKVKKELPAIKQEDVPEKKPKVEDEDEVDGKEKGIEDEIKTQTNLMFDYRDKLKKLSKRELQTLLESNKQEIPPGEDRILDRIADVMTFGALEPCKQCKGGQFVFNKLGYMCQGDLTEWTKCDVITKEPKRRKFVVPSELKTEYPFLKKYKYVPRTRVFRDVNPTVSQSLIKVEKVEENGGPKIKRETPPLYNMEFVIIGKFEDKKDQLKKHIIINGGKVVTKIKNTVMAVISTPEEVDKMNARIREAKDADVHVVSDDFLNEASNYSGRIPELVIEKSICDWGADPHTRLPPEPSSSNIKSKSTSMFASKSSKITLKLKNGGAVDPDSGLADRAHIYQSNGEKYTAVLGLTDIQRQRNSYYKLQLLQSDSGNRFWLFRSWGRIGTTIGGNKVEDLTLHEAKRQFCDLYLEKSGNLWEDRHNFIKIPGLMYPLDIDYGDEATEHKINTDSTASSKLLPPVRDLISLIFDVNMMKKVMLEFELDTEKMPLGKLSKAQLQKAYKVLSELQQLVDSDASLARFIDASNRFYTLVPHSFGIDNPPVINEMETIKKKIEMVENLMEIEIAYSMMKSTGSDNTIDDHYGKLKTEIGVLQQDSEEFKIISEYVKNTHAETHGNYELEIQDVFTIKRQGEERRYKPFRKLHNRKLLWHGSRTTNYAGILSQGLRIAPPEAPVTGYMFGKGIYFADMVSKSANYCCTSPNNSTGVLLLCEVALGEMHEFEEAQYVEKLPKGKHSVKGVGRTEPDPTIVKELQGGVQVPVGKGVVADKKKRSALLYNEYIVYDVAQVNIKYLLKMNFKYKY